MAYIPDYPQAPFDAVMPAAAQEIVLWIAIVALGLFLLLGAWQSVKHRTALPLLFFVAGFCTILLETLVTHVGHAIHPEVGQIMLFKTLDWAIPWHIALIYSFYFGGVYLFMFSRIREGTFTRDFVWKSYFFTCALALGESACRGTQRPGLGGPGTADRVPVLATARSGYRKPAGVGSSQVK